MPLVDDDGKWIPRRRPGPAKPLDRFTPSKVWQQSGVFVRDLSNFAGDRRFAAHAAGYRAVAVQLDHHAGATANLVEIDNLRAEFVQRGWYVGGWATFGQQTNESVFDEGRYQAFMANANRLDFWIANGEKWAEAENRWKSKDWMMGWIDWHTKNLRPLIPLMLSCLSSETGNFGIDMDFGPWLIYPGLMISPQCYQATDPDYTVAAMYASFRNTIVPANRLVPTLEVIEDKPMPVYPRLPVRWLWTGDDCRASRYSET